MRNRLVPFICMAMTLSWSALALASQVDPRPEPGITPSLLLAAALPPTQAMATAAQGSASPLRRTYPGLRALPGTISQSNVQTAAAAQAQGQETNMAPLFRVTTNAYGQQVLSNVPPPNVASEEQAIQSWTNHSNVTPIQLQNISRIDVALHNLELPHRDRAAQRQALIATLQDGLIVPESSRPPTGAVAQLGSSLAEVVPTLNFTGQQRHQLAIDLNMALNSANLGREEAQRVAANARSLLQGSAVNNPKGVADLSQTITTMVSQIQDQVASRGNSDATGPQGQAQGSATQNSQTGQAGASQIGTGEGGSSAQVPQK